MRTLDISPFEPVGTIVAFCGDVAAQNPPLSELGWLLCDGSCLDQVVYDELYAVIGTNFGSTGSGKFNLPQLQGYFLRGVSLTASSTDPDVAGRSYLQAGGNSGNNVGSVQTYGTAQPVKKFQGRYRTAGGNSGCEKVAGPDVANRGSGNTTPTISGGDSETRPKNKYVNFLIKFAQLTDDQDYVEIPPGSAVAFTSKQVAALGTDWLLCDGSSFTQGQNPALYSAVGIAHGQDSSSNPVLPDYRGYFLRGVSGNSGNDPNTGDRPAPYTAQGAKYNGNNGNKVGSQQAYATASPVSGSFTTTISKVLDGNDDKRGKAYSGTICKWNGGSVSITVDAGGDSESRPNNMAVDFYVRATQVDEQLLPAGFVVAYGGNASNPDLGSRWLLCDGKEYKQAEYPDLFKVVANSYGGDPAAGTFKLPNYQGQFLRGADRGTGNDPNASSRTWVGVAPPGALPSDPGTLQPFATAPPAGTNKFSCSATNLPMDWFDSSGGLRNGPKPDGNDYRDMTLNGGDSETRPKNVYVYFLIKSTNS